MTEQENKIIDITSNLWSNIVDLPVQHPDDIQDFRFHIHAIQVMIFARKTLREENLVSQEMPIKTTNK